MTDGGRSVQATVTGTGVLTFVAAAAIFDSLAVGQTDSFTFNYTISDGNGEGDTAAVTVTIVGENDGPAVSGAITASASEDDAVFSVDLLDGASDVDNGAVLTVQNLVLTSGQDAGVTVNGNSIQIDPSAYNSLAVNASEILAYSYDVVDEHGALVSQTATITIDGVNDLTDGDELNEEALASAGTVSQQLLDALTAAEAELVRLEVARQILIDKGDFSQPVAAQFSLFIAQAERAIEDAEADIAAAAVPADLTNVLANTDDPEPGAPFVLRVDGAATSVGAAVAGDNGGLFTISAVGAATFSANGEFSGLAIGDSAVTSITYTVGDVDGGEDQSTVTVTVNGVNDAPVAAPLAVTGDEDTVISGQLVAVDPDVGDVLAYSLQSQSLIGTTTVNSDGTFTWNPGNNGSNFNGDVTFDYRVSDGNGGTDVETVTVTVNPVNDAPVAAPLAVSGDENTAISGQLIATDPDVGDLLTFSLQSQSLIGTTTVNPDGAFTWNPGNNGVDFSGDLTFDYRVIDGNGGTDIETVTVTVNPVNDGSVANDALQVAGVSDSPVDDFAFLT